MTTLQILFWIALAIVFYSFVGYGILLYVLVKIKKAFSPSKKFQTDFQPEITLVIPCYNEADILLTKIKNCLELEYPSDKLKLVFITDGSTDNSVELLSKYAFIKNLHTNIRAGKTAAENRVMNFVNTPFVIFSDANTLLNKEAVKNIVRHFADDKVGCVSGEKRILTKEADVASAAGEGMYWKYESVLKKWDSELNSAVGAAGELVAFRSAIYEPMPQDTILDDYLQSMFIAGKGYKIVYEPEAYAVETASATVKEELKRKIRICAGGWQSINRLWSRISMFDQPVLFFQYISHRVIRWTVNPFLLIFIFIANLFLMNESTFFFIMMQAQILFYVAALTGFILAARELKVKAFFIPYYFFIMNYAVVHGFIRYLKGSQSAVWEKNTRMEASIS